jgi:hypothetical protein
MKHILLVESDEKTGAFLKLNLMKSIGCEVTEAGSAAEGASFLSRNRVDLVVCRLSDSKYFEPYPQVIMKLEDTWKSIVMKTGRTLKLNVSFIDSKIQSEYIPVGLGYFNVISSYSLECDVYIRVKKNEKESHYVKRLHAGDHFTAGAIEKYRDMGLKEFYIPKDQFAHFVNFVSEKLTADLSQAKIDKQSRAYEITLDRLHSLGIDELTVELVEESVKAMENSLKSMNGLSEFLQSMRANKISYSYAHSYLICLILHKIVDHFDWETTKMRERMTYIAYFHDISLENPDWMPINSESMLDETLLTREQKKQIQNHALESASIIERFPKIPMGIGTILKEHHGSKTGIGFPETLSISIAPLSMMFMVVESFVGDFLELEEPRQEDLTRIIQKLGARYNKVVYLQTVQALEAMILKQKKKAS